MAQVGLSLDFSGYTGSLIVVCKKATAPLAEVTRSAALPFPVSQIITIPNLTNEVYIFEFWQSTNGTSLNTLIRTWSIDASAFTGGTATLYEYVVGRGQSGTNPNWADPVDQATSITDQRLAGAAPEDIQVSMRGTGIRGTDEYALIPTGGIQLLTGGETFNLNDRIFITRFQRSSATQGAVTDYADYVAVTSNIAYNSTHKNKLIDCTASGAVTVYSLPALTTLADQKLKFSTHGMTGNIFSIQLFAGNTILFRGTTRNVMHLGRGENLEILIKNNTIRILDSDTEHRFVGRRMLVDKVGINQKLLDGTQYLVADHPRIVEFIKSLPAAQVLTNFAAWLGDPHKWFLNEAATPQVFNVPDDRDMHYRALSIFDGSVVVGRYEADGIKAHTHTTDIPSRNLSNDSTTGPDLTGPDGGATGGSKRTFTTSSAGGAQNTVKNAGQLAATTF